MPELEELSLPRFCNYVWFMVSKNKEEQDRKTLHAQIWRPPTTGEPIPESSPWSAENENKSLAALKSSAGGSSGGVSTG